MSNRPPANVQAIGVARSNRCCCSRVSRVSTRGIDSRQTSVVSSSTGFSRSARRTSRNVASHAASSVARPRFRSVCASSASRPSGDPRPCWTAVSRMTSWPSALVRPTRRGPVHGGPEVQLVVDGVLRGVEPRVGARRRAPGLLEPVEALGAGAVAAVLHLRVDGPQRREVPAHGGVVAGRRGVALHHEQEVVRAAGEPGPTGGDAATVVEAVGRGVGQLDRRVLERADDRLGDASAVRVGEAREALGVAGGGVRRPAPAGDGPPRQPGEDQEAASVHRRDGRPSEGAGHPQVVDTLGDRDTLRRHGALPVLAVPHTEDRRERCVGTEPSRWGPSSI